MDPNSRIREKGPGFRNEMFQEIARHLIQNYITNEEVRNRIKQASSPYEDLLSTITLCKLIWFGHVIRVGGLAKTVVQGTVRGGRKRGRQKKRWEDNIAEWTELKLSEAIRHAEDREKWGKLVYRLSAALQRQPPLDR